MRRLTLFLCAIAASACAACSATASNPAEPRYTAAGFLIEEGETYDAHGYPISETMCGSWNGVAECRPASRRDQLEGFPDHPDRFIQTDMLEIGPLSLIQPEGVRLINACIGALPQEAWDALQAEGEAGECLWVRAAEFETVMTSLSEQIRAAGFVDEMTRAPNPQAINRSTRFTRGCEMAGLVVIFADQLLNRPPEPHIHVLVAHSRLNC